jgi:hypothetical protein
MYHHCDVGGRRFVGAQTFFPDVFEREVSRSTYIPRDAFQSRQVAVDQQYLLGLPDRFCLHAFFGLLTRNAMTSLLLTLLPVQLFLAQTEQYPSGGGSPAGLIVGLLVAVIVIAAMWKIFTKAGQPGWASLIPIYNIYILCKIVGRPGWWVILMFIPIVNLIIWIIVSIDVAKNFGKGTGFGIGLALLGFIFYPILGFGSAHYQGQASM